MFAVPTYTVLNAGCKNGTSITALRSMKPIINEPFKYLLLNISFLNITGLSLFELKPWKSLERQSVAKAIVLAACVLILRPK